MSAEFSAYRMLRRVASSGCALAVLAASAFGQTSSPVQVNWKYNAGSRIYSTPVIVPSSSAANDERILVVSSAMHKLICLDSSGHDRWTFADFTGRLTSPVTCADIDADGSPEVLIGSRQEGVTCLAADGTLRWRHEVPGGIAWSRIAVADADADGRPEAYALSRHGRLECLDATGQTQWSCQVPGAGEKRKLDTSPCIGDADGQGGSEIVVCGIDAVDCLDARGSLKWRASCMSEPSGTPLIADLRKDGLPEVLVTTRQGVLFCLNGKTGAVLWNHRTFSVRVDSTLVSADLDDDGVKEILYGDGKGMLYCIGADGRERWSFEAQGWIENAPAVADVDDDADEEILFGSADGKIYCLSAAGSCEWMFHTNGRVSASPAAAARTGKAGVEIFAASHDGWLYSLSPPGPVSDRTGAGLVP